MTALRQNIFCDLAYLVEPTQRQNPLTKLDSSIMKLDPGMGSSGNGVKSAFDLHRAC